MSPANKVLYLPSLVEMGGKGARWANKLNGLLAHSTEFLLPPEVYYAEWNDTRPHSTCQSLANHSGPAYREACGVQSEDSAWFLWASAVKKSIWSVLRNEKHCCYNRGNVIALLTKGTILSDCKKKGTWHLYGVRQKGRWNIGYAELAIQGGL